MFKDYPNDYCAQMKEVPASSIGSLSGANYVNIGKPKLQNLKGEKKQLHLNLTAKARENWEKVASLFIQEGHFIAYAIVEIFIKNSCEIFKEV